MFRSCQLIILSVLFVWICQGNSTRDTVPPPKIKPVTEDVPEKWKLTTSLSTKPEQEPLLTPGYPEYSNNQVKLKNEYINTTQGGIDFVASIELKNTNEHFCVGTVVSPFIVLSSFDCVHRVDSVSDRLQIRVGSVVAGEGGYVYNVFESYGIHYGNAKEVPKKETWGLSNNELNDEVMSGRKSFRTEEKKDRKSLNTPKVCEKSTEIHPFRYQELFEAERYLKKHNAEYLILVTCEPIEKHAEVGYAQFATYHGPFRPGSAFIFSFAKENGKLRRTMMSTTVATACAPHFSKAYHAGINKGIVLENYYACVTDKLNDRDVSTKDSGFCDSQSGAPIFINFHGSLLFQGLTVFSRTCTDYVNPVIVRVFDNKVSRTLSQIIFS